MATLAEELEKWKRKHPELASKGMVSVGDPDTPGPRPGLITSDTLKSPEFRRGEARTSFLDKIGARYTEDVDAQGMTWQEKTGMQLYDPAAQKRFLFRKELKAAREAPYRTQAMRHAKLAEIIGADIASERKAGVDIATGLMTAEATRERTGVMELGDIETARHRAALEGFRTEEIDISRAGLESIDIGRRATAGYQAGMLEVARETRPGSLESRIAGLEKQWTKDVSDVIQDTGPPKGILDKSKRSVWRIDAPNKSMLAIQAIDKQYKEIISRLKGAKAPMKGAKALVEGVKAPSFDEQTARFRAKGQEMPFTREEYEAWLETEEAKKRYPGGK